jgi:hypothetical protein
MKLIFFCFAFLIAINSIAQKNIDSLIQAEKNFAAFSVANSTKEAFLKFLDSSGIVFEQGKSRNGIEVWNAREKRPGILNWSPLFAEISSSNDFGYTTGQWTYQASKNDTVIARGQYTTVWQINKQGEWKFLIDLGVSNTVGNLSNDVIKVSALKEPVKLSDTSSLIATEKSFIELFSRNKAEAYKKYLSKQCILNRMKQAVAVYQKVLIDSTSSSIQYTIDGWRISPGLDMGYVYGTTILNGKTENYQRIWRHEKNGWKIALEVLRY